MRLGVRPPDVQESWDDCTTHTQARILAFEEILEREEAESGGQMRCPMF